MFNIGSGEMMALAILALLIFGPEGLPEMAKKVARTLRALKQAATDFQYEVNQALEIESQRQQAQRRRRKVIVEPEPESEQQSTIAEQEIKAKAGEGSEESASKSSFELNPEENTATPGDGLDLPEAQPVPDTLQPKLEPEAIVSNDLEQTTATNPSPLSPPGHTGDAPLPEQASIVEDDDDGPGMPMQRQTTKSVSPPADTEVEHHLEPTA